MTNSKHRPPDHNGSQPDDAREPDREMPDREMGVSGLPRAKLFYMTSGYGFGEMPEGEDRERSAGLAS